jgi:ribosomal protein S12 methylthiotransferase accessory factor
MQDSVAATVTPDRNHDSAAGPTSSQGPAMSEGAAFGDVLDALRANAARYGFRLPDDPVLGLFDAFAAGLREPAGDVLPVYLTTTALLIAPPPDPAAGPMPCAGCLALRWQKMRSKQERDVLERDSTFEAAGDNPFYRMPTLRLAARHLVDWVCGDGGRDRTDPHRLPYVYAWFHETGLMRRFPLVPDPACRCTALPDDSRELATVTLRDRAKRSPTSYRLNSVGDYQLPYEAFANPISGVIGDGMVPDTGSTTTAPVTGFMYMRGSWMLHEFFWSGHGDSYQESAALAVLEGLERYAGLKRARVGGLLRAPMRELGDDALDPRDCGVYTEEFYATERFFMPFTEDLPTNWVWGYSLRDERPILVPERLVYYLDSDPDSNFIQECSNGCAAGSTLEEAILYGMLELIERDAFLIGWYGKAVLREIDAASVDDASIQYMLARMRLIGFDVRLFDNRIDIDVPVVTAVAVRRDPTARGQICVAAGSSLDPVDAIRAALCEIASYAPSFEQRVVGQLELVEQMIDDYSAVRELPHHALLFGVPEMLPEIDFLLGPSRAESFDAIYGDWLERRPSSMNLMDDVRHCVDQIVSAGHDVIVVEQTSPEQELIGIKTACVVAPGLIPIDFGWNKQRALHMPRVGDALVRAGYRSEPLMSADVHRVPHPFP